MEPCAQRLKLSGNALGSIYFAHEKRGGSEDYYELIGSRSDSASSPSDGIVLGEIFSYDVNVQGDNMTVTISRDGKPDVVQDVDVSSYSVGGEYLYFKIDVYSHNDSGEDDDHVQATFYKIENC